MREHRFPARIGRMVTVIKASGDVIHIGDASAALSMDRAEAAKLLSRWTHQGWLRRVGPGAYVPISLDSLGIEQVLTDPWVLVPALFSPGYIGGWTAAHNWGLTEQLFRPILVMTAQAIRERRQTRHGVHFVLRHIKESNMFGTKTIWRRRTKVVIADVHRTIVDMLDEPALGGGIQHASDCLTAYLKHTDRNDTALIEYAQRIRNGAVFKRLGFLSERSVGASRLAEKCLSKITQGNSKLDPALECPRLISRWNLWIPKAW